MSDWKCPICKKAFGWKEVCPAEVTTYFDGFKRIFDEKTEIKDLPPMIFCLNPDCGRELKVSDIN